MYIIIVATVTMTDFIRCHLFFLLYDKQYFLGDRSQSGTLSCVNLLKMCLYQHGGGWGAKNMENVIGCMFSVIPSYFSKGREGRHEGGFYIQGSWRRAGGRFLCPEAVILFCTFCERA